MDKQISFDQCKPKCTGLVVIGYEKSFNSELDKFKSFKDQYAAYKGETLLPQFYESRYLSLEKGFLWAMVYEKLK